MCLPFYNKVLNKTTLVTLNLFSRDSNVLLATFRFSFHLFLSIYLFFYFIKKLRIAIKISVLFNHFCTYLKALKISWLKIERVSVIHCNETPVISTSRVACKSGFTFTRLLLIGKKQLLIMLS